MKENDFFLNNVIEEQEEDNDNDSFLIQKKRNQLFSIQDNEFNSYQNNNKYNFNLFDYKDPNEIKDNLKNDSSNNSSSTKENKILNEIKNESSNDKNELLHKKKKPRIHLEDLNIDPKNKFETICDKVILSKNKKLLTADDKKEIKAIRNRISAQKSRDKKKIQFANLNEQVKILQQQLNQKISIIESYQQIVCDSCRLKLQEIDFKNFENDDNKEIEENEDLVLEENNSFFSSKKLSMFKNISGTLIGLVCIVSIAICIFEGRNFISQKIYDMKLSGADESMRHLSNDVGGGNIGHIYQKNDSNNSLQDMLDSKINDDDNLIQICHDKFLLEISNIIKKKNEIKKGFLLKKEMDEPVCFDSENNNSINNSKNIYSNNLPIKVNNAINNNLSCKIISILVKDYESLKNNDNGKYLSLEEQITIQAKNSEEGFVYLQMILPKKSNNFTTGNYTKYENKYYEIRCKIFSYNNFYDKRIFSK